MLKKIKNLNTYLQAPIRNTLDDVFSFLINDKYEDIKRAFKGSGALPEFGHKMYSQNDEDGIIQEIFNRIGTTNKLFVEFGVGDGLENNTAALLLCGWHGLWIDGSESNVHIIRQGLKNCIQKNRLIVKESFITRDNINDLISSSVSEKQIDLLSIDIDGNDAHIFDAINCITPRVVVIEYNSKFIPPVSFCMPYKEKQVWDKTDNFGASLKYLECQFAKKGYLLVGCSLSGINAFFVRQDLIGTKFNGPFTAEMHYQPPRYYLNKIFAGHKPSYETIDQIISMEAQ